MKRILLIGVLALSALGLWGHENAVAIEPADSVAVPAVSTAEPRPWGEYWATFYGGSATGDFAPYMIGSLTHGKTPQKSTALFEVGVARQIDRAQRFSWGFGASVVAGYTSSNDYALWDEAEKQWTSHSEGPRPGWIQQLYGEIKYRSLFLTVGMKELESPLLNQQLSSGDLVQSGNARPIPQIRAGFIDFVDFPWTKGWLQVQGELAYGRTMDTGWVKRHYNYYSYHINLNALYTYKRLYFRSNPSKPFSATIGMQAASFFGGKLRKYQQGRLIETQKMSQDALTFLKMLLPLWENGEMYFVGSTLGSWDIHLRYRLRSGDEIIGYLHGPWEDGSGIGRLNKLDGVWGLEYKRAQKGWINGVVIEYLDFRDQSGPIHHDPADFEASTVTTQATGQDDYYNNAFFNSYAYYGMGLGTPVFKAPIYNLDGFPGFACNRFNGFHAGINGQISPSVSYRVLASHMRGLGRYDDPYYHPKYNTSMLFEAGWDANCILAGLTAKAQIAFDHGDLRGNTFGGMFTLSYRGIISGKR